MCVLLHINMVYGSTLYVSPSGTGGVCTDSDPCSYSTGKSSMAGGDTLIFKDGSYNTGISAVLNGTSGAYTTFKAQNDGAVIFTAPFSLSHTSSYIKFEGIKFEYASGKSIIGNHIAFYRCSFIGGGSSDNVVNVGIGTNDYDDTAYILLEDCWAYGEGGRYKVMVYNSDKVVLRRVVVRDDGGWADGGSGNPEAGITVYQSSNVSLQNCIVIDSSLSSYASTNIGAYYLTGHAGNRPSSNVEYLGCMAINNKKWGMQIDTDDGAEGLSIRNLIVYGQETGAIAQSNTSVAIDLQNAILGNTGYGVGNWGSKSNSLSYFVFVALTGTASTGSNSLSNYSTFASTPLAKSSGQHYLTRAESASALSNATQGATALYKYGTSGTGWGDTGYNTITSDSLWPWPNESRIKSDFAGVSARGFAAAGKQINGTDDVTLTSYIWEYLGNAMPSDIYGAVPGTCGSSNGLSLSTAPSTGLCSAGTASAVTGTGPFLWTCAGSGGGGTASCGASLATRSVSIKLGSGKMTGTLR